MPASTPPSYEQLEQRLAAWAAARSDLFAVFIIGSRSRTGRPADAWSDLDCILFVENAARFRQAGGWQHDLQAALDWPAWFVAGGAVFSGDPEWVYVMAGGLKIDLVFASNYAGSQASLNEIATASPYQNIFRAGSRVLVDKSAKRQPYRQPDPPAGQARPTQAEFDNLIANLLLRLVRAAKLARRGELWRAAQAINAEWQQNLLALLEWHALSASQPRVQRWPDGRFLEEWADPRALAALPELFAAPTLPALRRTVHACLDLLAWLGPETAARLTLHYPQSSVQPASDWLRQTLPPIASADFPTA